ncbi:hypothetical protein EON65_44715 [archaeon]|nr:MAG: hypothetical protein EON65_44715 [archaeon]
MSIYDEKTKWTAADSFLCKFHAVEKDYYPDSHAKAMFTHMSKKVQLHSNRKSPLINRGYYARVYGNRLILSEFLKSTEGQARQLVYFGAGYDSDPLHSYEQAGPNTKVFELDFPDVMQTKYEIFQTKYFSHLCGEDTEDSGTAHPPNPSIHRLGSFRFIGVDLRNTKLVIDLLAQAAFDSNLPTFFLSECVLVYMPRDTVLSLIQEVGGMVQHQATWVSYDMVSPHDRYGEMMVKNLEGAGLHIPGIVDFPTVSAHNERFVHNHWDSAHTVTMKQFYTRCIADEEKARLRGLEMFDEIEEWNMLMDHYTFTVAIKNFAVFDEHVAGNILKVVGK